jgi:hypothetical protein
MSRDEMWEPSGGGRIERDVRRDVTVRGTAGCIQWTAHVSNTGDRVTTGGVSVSGRQNWSIVGNTTESFDRDHVTVAMTGMGRTEAADLADALEAAAAARRSLTSSNDG